MEITFKIEKDKAEIIKVDFSSSEIREINEFEFERLKQLYIENLINISVKTIIKDFKNDGE
jgi:hypothetical protein